VARNRVAVNDLLISAHQSVAGGTPLDLDRKNLAILRRLAVPRIS
jgi:hypothetical protein